jgi:hypothetical protein
VARTAAARRRGQAVRRFREFRFQELLGQDIEPSLETMMEGGVKLAVGGRPRTVREFKDEDERVTGRRGFRERVELVLARSSDSFILVVSH